MGSLTHQNQRAWWTAEQQHAAPAPPRFSAVAYYRHSARDRQENSVAIQQELVRKWAEENRVDIVREFADLGKSGLTAEGRDGFNEMMNNWVKRRDDFEFVLCLDVSRWGRFQDIDLSATYSADCKRHGKDVIYTTLGMPRPDDPLYKVYLQFERFRAAQFSKELSVKVFHGCITIAKQGYWAGGKPPYGYDRLLLDEARRPLHVLEPSQKKSIQNQRVTLTPGDKEHVATVRRVFHEFTQDGEARDLGQRMQNLGDELNHDGIPAPGGGLWDGVKIRRVLTNPMYAGTLVYNKTTQKLMTPTRRNPKDQWIRTAGAFEPVVDPEVFEQAQFIFAQAALRFSPEVMIAHLERIHQEFGFVRPALLRADKAAPSASTYAKHFRSLDAAYQDVFRTTVNEVAQEVETKLRGQVEQIERYEDFLVINRRFTVLIQPSVPVSHGYRQYWYFRPDVRSMIDITLGVPISGPDGPQILGYLALPRLLVRDSGIRLFGSSETRLDMYGHAGLEIIVQLART